jgi:hypothetical protein
MILIIMRKPGICKCGHEYDARSKTKMCLTCYREHQKLNKKQFVSGSQCKDASGKTHYQRNKQYYLDRNGERKKMLVEFVENYKKSHPCVDCGNSDIRVLEFDHIGDDKEIDISRATRSGWSKERIQLEIEKCEVRCANCHRIVTWERRNAL